MKAILFRVIGWCLFGLAVLVCLTPIAIIALCLFLMASLYGVV